MTVALFGRMEMEVVGSCLWFNKIIQLNQDIKRNGNEDGELLTASHREGGERERERRVRFRK